MVVAQLIALVTEFSSSPFQCSSKIPQHLSIEPTHKLKNHTAPCADHTKDPVAKRQIFSLEMDSAAKLGKTGCEKLAGAEFRNRYPSEGNFERRFSRLFSQEDVEGDHRLVKIRLK
jgi:hypothetical protein